MVFSLLSISAAGKNYFTSSRPFSMTELFPLPGDGPSQIVHHKLKISLTVFGQNLGKNVSVDFILFFSAKIYQF